jgi:hypothetical protein
MTAFVLFLVWGIGAVFVYGGVLFQRRARWHLHKHDRRKGVRDDARGDYRTAVGLFLTAVGAMLATAFVLFGEYGSGPRVIAISLSLGAFLGVGIIMLLEGGTVDTDQ